MLFSSLPFLFYFLPCALGLYFLVPGRLKNAALLLCSLVFYAWGEPRFVGFMAAAILQGYAAARLMERYPTRRRLLLTLSAVLSLGILAYCKYADFLISGFNAVTGLSVPLLRMALPIGISFYTFQILSYVIDVYRGDAPAQRNLIDLAAYIAMYPQLVAGPIVRYADVAPQLRSRTHTVQDAALGARRFVLGLGKKVLLANVLYELVTVYQQSGQKTVLLTWLYAATYMFHVYFDFSGYSDMAIGLGRIMGFRFAENFRYPFVSGSLTEFWRRWHISLGSWFRDYVYIPLGGSREGTARTYLNLLAVWVLTGLWHGSTLNFLLWGLLLFALIALERAGWGRVLARSRVISRVYMVLMIPLSWMLFAIPSVSRIGVYLGRLFPLVSQGIAVNAGDWLQYGKQYWWLLVLGIVFSTPGPEKLWNRIRGTWLGTVILALLFWACVYCMSVATNDPFMYFSF